ncbi:hypothetical protein [Kribbella sindirgiensis]|uniref:Uncharacterized protein n=1 Tax=Kribbella sindirgiensis TaxID=1124744 RepID=A0A4R0I059_9ACTN|nr:hypothetical protein [Kribbella sindirgiensis]TCC19948.1 hypothetical protein E0H50_37595 [Kribbella sindirgiensis]
MIADDLRFCGNCAQMLASGEINDGTDLQARHSYAMDQYCKAWWSSTPGVVLVVGEIDAEFSSAECDACGTILAGERWNGAALR